MTGATVLAIFRVIIIISGSSVLRYLATVGKKTQKRGGHHEQRGHLPLQLLLKK